MAPAAALPGVRCGPESGRSEGLMPMKRGQVAEALGLSNGLLGRPRPGRVVVERHAQASRRGPSPFTSVVQGPERRNVIVPDRRLPFRRQNHARLPVSASRRRGDEGRSVRWDGRDQEQRRERPGVAHLAEGDRGERGAHRRREHATAYPGVGPAHGRRAAKGCQILTVQLRC